MWMNELTIQVSHKHKSREYFFKFSFQFKYVNVHTNSSIIGIGGRVYMRRYMRGDCAILVSGNRAFIKVTRAGLKKKTVWLRIIFILLLFLFFFSAIIFPFINFSSFQCKIRKAKILIRTRKNILLSLKHVCAFSPRIKQRALCKIKSRLYI